MFLFFFWSFLFIFFIAIRKAASQAVTDEYIKSNTWLTFSGFNNISKQTFTFQDLHLYILIHLIQQYLPRQKKFGRQQYRKFEEEWKNFKPSQQNELALECKKYLLTLDDETLYSEWYTKAQLTEMTGDIDITTTNVRNNNNKNSKQKNKSHNRKSMSPIKNNNTNNNKTKQSYVI